MIALAGTCDLDLLKRGDRPVGNLRPVDLDMLQQHILDLVADLSDRIERQARALENHRHFATAQIAHLVLGRCLDIDAGEHHRALGDLAGAIEDSHHRIGRH